MSFDMWDHHLPFFELYGTTGSIAIPRPSTFEGPILLRTFDGPDWQSVPLEFPRGLNRGIGIADMAFSIMRNEPHRSTAELMLHVTEVLEALSVSCRTGKTVDLRTTCHPILPMPRRLPYRLIPETLSRENQRKILTYFAGWTPKKKEQTGWIDGIATPLSRVILGTVGIDPSSYRSQMASFALLDSALELGCQTFDTAAMYGNEKTLGEWIKISGVRDEIVLMTKGGFPFPDGGHRLSRAELTFDLERSLDQLNVDYIDLYLVHYDDPNAPIDIIMETLNEYQQNGMIRSLGVSNWTTKRIEEANTYADEHDLAPLVASSVHFSLIPWAYPLWPGAVSLAADAAVDGEVPWYVENRLPLLAYSPLSRGFFADWFDPDSLEPRSKQIQQAFGSEKNVEKKRRAEALAKRKGLTRAQIALAYVFNQPLDIYTIVGVKEVRKLKENIEAVDIELTKAEMAWLALARDHL
jgi:aryl-alcohol dehydrogenase-like predicted oxidoreductase